MRLCRLARGASLVTVLPIRDQSASCVLGVSDGTATRVDLAMVRPQSPVTIGPRLVRIRTGQHLAGAAAVHAEAEVLLVTRTGFAKRLRVHDIPLRFRGGLGLQSVLLGNGDLLADVAVCPAGGDVVFLTDQTKALRCSSDELPLRRRAARGSPALALAEGEHVRAARVLRPRA